MILVVDDEISILELLRFNLAREGYRVLTANDGQQALHCARAEKPDLIILDIMLPVMDGYEVCRILKAGKETAGIPVLMLSARDDVLDKVVGLELGADDYIAKPFSPRELVARVKANLRRKAQASARQLEGRAGEIKVDQLVIRPEKYEAVLDGEKLDLTPKEFELLSLMAENPGRVFSRDVLLEKIWSYVSARETRTVDVHIRYLRQKVERNPARPQYIETVRGVGYRFKASR
ncbi:MAG: Response regulator [Pelotomaculum thermopropionicum]|uniref:Stage 0 sporulation protein A homolog n=1 Tax=Pelotomaculum thermopropionicum TaxID=110500 RepID=A0A101HSF3_9FIRM|nr:MAG: Response regulator [Pelotomaculum thermopropionicum]